MKTLLALQFCLFLLITACSTAGPYVTNISHDGDSGLTVEKCMVEMNAFMGTISNKDCKSSQIYLKGNRSTATEQK